MLDKNLPNTTTTCVTIEKLLYTDQYSGNSFAAV